MPAPHQKLFYFLPDDANREPKNVETLTKIKTNSATTISGGRRNAKNTTSTKSVSNTLARKGYSNNSSRLITNMGISSLEK